MTLFACFCHMVCIVCMYKWLHFLTTYLFLKIGKTSKNREMTHISTSASCQLQGRGVGSPVPCRCLSGLSVVNFMAPCGAIALSLTDSAIAPPLTPYPCLVYVFV